VTLTLTSICVICFVFVFRYMRGEGEDLPDWFSRDEKKHIQRQLPITKVTHPPLFMLSPTFIWVQDNSDSKAGFPIAMKRDLRRRRCAICGSFFLLLYFQTLQHSAISVTIFSFWILSPHHIRLLYHSVSKR
jgi:hypothetical protein